MIRDLVATGAKAGDLHNDVAPDELASYCLHALAGGQQPAVQGRGPPPRHSHSGWVKPQALTHSNAAEAGSPPHRFAARRQIVAPRTAKRRSGSNMPAQKLVFVPSHCYD